MTTLDLPCTDCGDPEAEPRPNGFRLIHGRCYPVTIQLCDWCAATAKSERDRQRSS